MHKLILNTLVSASLAAAGGSPALAQTAPGADGPQVLRFSQRHQQEQRASGLPGERIEGQLVELQTALKITAAQQPQWNAYAETLRKHAREMDQRRQAQRSQLARGPNDAKPTAIDRLQLRQERLAAASARLSETLAVAKPLYAALTPEQQRLADELLAPRRDGTRQRKEIRPAA